MNFVPETSSHFKTHLLGATNKFLFLKQRQLNCVKPFLSAEREREKREGIVLERERLSKNEWDLSPLQSTKIFLTWAPLLTSDMTSIPPPLWTYQSRDSRDTSCGSVHMMDWMKILTMLLTFLQERCKVGLMHCPLNTCTGKPFN